MRSRATRGRQRASRNGPTTRLWGQSQRKSRADEQREEQQAHEQVPQHELGEEAEDNVEHVHVEHRLESHAGQERLHLARKASGSPLKEHAEDEQAGHGVRQGIEDGLAGLDKSTRGATERLAWLCSRLSMRTELSKS